MSIDKNTPRREELGDGELHFTFRGTVDKIVSAGEVLATVDLGFHVAKEVPVSVFGIDPPDDADETGRGEGYTEAVALWLDNAAAAYAGDDGYPLSILTLRSRKGTRTEYEGLIYSRATGEALNHSLREEFPEVADL